MELIWNNFIYLLVLIGLLTGIVFFVGDKLAFYANQLSVVSGISGAFIGFVLIAMITSIPELVSTFVAVHKGLFGLAAGGVFGSNMVNIAILSAIFIMFKDKKLKISSSSIFSFLSSLILLGIVGIVVVAYPISKIIINKYIIGLIFIIMYCFIIRHAYDLNKNHENEKKSKTNLSLLEVLIPFVLYAGAIVVLSWILVIICQQMAVVPVPIYGKPLEEHFIGTLILAFATSIPELATTFQIVRRGFTSMAVENIAGSNVFNLLVLVMASFFSTNDFWMRIPVNSIYTIFTIFIASLLMCMVSLIRESKKITYTVHTIIIMLWLYSLIIVF